MGEEKAPLYELNIIPTDYFVETVCYFFFCTVLVDTHKSKRSKAVSALPGQLLAPQSMCGGVETAGALRWTWCTG